MVLRPSHPPLWEAAFGCPHGSEAGAFGASSTAVASIMVGLWPANHALQPYKQYPRSEHVFQIFGKWCPDWIWVLKIALSGQARYWVPHSSVFNYPSFMDELSTHQFITHPASGSMSQLCHGLCGGALAYLISIGFYNFLGVTVSGELTAVHRTLVKLRFH